MARPSTAKKFKVSDKAVAAVTLAVALILTAVFIVLGFTGRNMDADGLYKLLPWLPVPGETTLWRQALKPSADLGATREYTFAIRLEEAKDAADAADNTAENNAAVDTADNDVADDTEAKDAADNTADNDAAVDIDEITRILSLRMSAMGWYGASVVAEEGKLKVTVPLAEAGAQTAALFSARGEVAFADPSNEPFLTGDHIVETDYRETVDKGVYALSFRLDNEGKDIFAEQSAALIGQSISIMVDGQVVKSPRITEALTEGMASIPGFSEVEARNLAAIIKSGPLPAALTEEAAQDGPPAFGNNVQRTLIIALAAAVLIIFLYLVYENRLSGLVAAWVLGVQLAAGYFTAALMGARFTAPTLMGIYASFLLALYSVMFIFRGMRGDLARGRSIRQALRESYADAGHVSLDVLVSLLLVTIIVMIMDTGAIGLFMRLLAVGLLINLALIHIALKGLLSCVITLLGEKTSLYYRAGGKETN